MATYTRQILARLGTSKTGLAGTLGVAVIDIDGTTRLSRTTSGISEQGATGTYYKSVTWDSAWGDCRAVWDDSAGSPTFQVVGDEAKRAGDVLYVNGTAQTAGDLAALIAAISTGSGSGARTITITVNDGSTAIQGATVRLTNGLQTYTATTNASGVATLNVDDATWTVAITKLGYSFAGASLVVDGNETQTYSMTAVNISPAAPGQTTGYLTTRDGGGDVQGGVTITFKLVSGPGTAGNSYNSGEFTATSNGSGLLEVTLIQSAKYIATRGELEVEFTTGTASTYELPEVLGIDAN